MSRNKKQISVYLSADPVGNEKRFIQVGNSLLLHPASKALSGNERILYLCLVMEAGGKPEVEFTHSVAKKYGFSTSTFDRGIKKLISSGFISKVQTSDYRFDRARFRFSPEWKKTKSAPHFE